MNYPRNASSQFFMLKIIVVALLNQGTSSSNMSNLIQPQDACFCFNFADLHTGREDIHLDFAKIKSWEKRI